MTAPAAERPRPPAASRLGAATGTERALSSQSSPDDRSSHSASLGVLTLSALGVVFGDIGTSPLYALRECFYGPHAVPVTHDHVLGVLSLIFWALVDDITVK
jgi:K+ transporter